MAGKLFPVIFLEVFGWIDGWMDRWYLNYTIYLTIQPAFPPTKKNIPETPTHNMVNEQLRLDAQRGDRRAQYQLYQRCFNVLMSVCMRYRKSEEEAAAMVNMGFLKIIQNLGKYQEPVPFEAWIRRIMINTLIDDFRKNRKVNELIENRDFSDTDNQKGLVEFNTADLDFDASDLEAMIHQLPSMSRKVFNLYAIDGYTHKEIGELLDISDGTSKWHLSFARSKLKEMMEKKKKSDIRSQRSDFQPLPSDL
ncbi:MAG: RNA polymerase sigma factor [Saprospiraceae bacterium]